jgi:hypothetical protein
MRMLPRMSSALSAVLPSMVLEAAAPLAEAAAAVLPATGRSSCPTAAFGDGSALSSMAAERLHRMKPP